MHILCVQAFLWLSAKSQLDWIYEPTTGALVPDPGDATKTGLVLLETCASLCSSLKTEIHNIESNMRQFGLLSQEKYRGTLKTSSKWNKKISFL